MGLNFFALFLFSLPSFSSRRIMTSIFYDHGIGSISINDSFLFKLFN